MRAKLAEVGASSERWASWKEESGWIIKLEFSANDVEHDARWSFDPRRSALSPLNADATQLSRQGSLPEGLIPRLRAVEADRAASPYKDDSRFDSGAFGPRLVPAPAAEAEEPAQPERSAPAVEDAAINRAPDAASTSPETADLLEALRRRRGQREAAPIEHEIEDVQDDTDPIALFAALEEPDDEPAAPEPTPRQPSSNDAGDSGGRRRRRNAMPSWDEIVFGARTDE